MLMLAGTALCGCSGNEVAVPAEDKPVLFTGTIKPFEGEDSQSRVNVEGTGFTDGDFIRIKVICPYVTSSEYGEQTYGASYDSFWLLKSAGGSSWGTLSASDGCDINGDYLDSGSQPMSSLYLSQQTPYVFTAQTWSVERKFVAGSNLVLLYSPIFHADQSRKENYRASDLLWAQSYLQTGSESVHFDFYHKMAALEITIDDSLPEGKKLSDNAILSLSGMPGIDHAEVVVGDYYAAKSKTDVAFGYKQKNSCTKENNGKVLGVAVNTDSYAYTMPMTGNPNPDSRSCVPNDGTYTAYKAATKLYRLIVPPCVLENKNKPVFHLLDGNRRWTYELNQLTFEQGNLYKIKINVVPDSPSISTE